MPEKNQNCGNCYFFYQTSTKGDQKIGYCRANPPTPYFEVDQTTGIVVPKVGRFPVVLNNMWCGAYDESDVGPKTLANTGVNGKALKAVAR